MVNEEGNDIRDSFQGLTPEELEFFRDTRPTSVDSWQALSRLVDGFNPPIESSRLIKPALVKAISFKRGLLIQGRCGNGKTSFLHALLEKCRADAVKHVSCDCWNEASIISACSSIFTTTTVVIIDDLGVDSPCVEFGTKKDYGVALIQRLYTCKCPFVISTNLDATWIGERYGDRIYDRLKEMCCIYDHALPSFRKSVVL